MTIHQFPAGQLNDSGGWPTLDMPRPDSGDRHVQHATSVTMRVDATDQFIEVPVRAVFTDDGLTGWSLEIGPYSVAGPDACALANALVGYGQLSGEYLRHTDPETA